MELKQIGVPLLSISMALVFLYFGFSQIYTPDDWTGFIPEYLTGTVLTATNWVMINGILELTLGTFLLIGLYIRFSSLVLGTHLLFIALSVGLNPVGVRDFGLAMATLALFLIGPTYGLDKRFSKKTAQ